MAHDLIKLKNYLKLISKKISYLVLDKIKNKIRKKNFYWQFRHILNPKIWEIYYDNSNVKRRDFYSKYVHQNNLRTLFEFGCASGPNLSNLTKNVSWDIYYFGYDISKTAIRFANQKLKKDNYFFTNKLNKRILKMQLNIWQKKFFALSIYDRVLYLLSEKEIRKHFFEYKDFLSKVIIDDFHNSKFQDKNEAYYSKNYEMILYPFGFKLIKNDPSEHFLGDDDFFKRSSRRLIFEKLSE